jgi:hypothetical protein
MLQRKMEYGTDEQGIMIEEGTTDERTANS